MTTLPQSRAALLLLAALLGVSAAPAGAQDLNRVEVTGASPLRFDITASCPSVSAELGDALSGPINREGAYGVTDVTLSIDAQGTATMEARGGPRVYRQALRRAMRQLGCLEANAGKRFQFQVAFVAEDASASQAVAAGPGVLVVAGR